MKSNTEPAITVASLTAAVAAIVGLLVAFGVPLTDAQTQAILGVVAVVGPLAVGLLARRLVTPNNKVAVQVDNAGTVAGDASPLPTGTPVVVAEEPVEGDVV